MIDQLEVLKGIFTEYRNKKLVEYNLRQTLNRVSKEAQMIQEEALSFCHITVGDTFVDGEESFKVESVSLAFNETGEEMFFVVSGEENVKYCNIEGIFSQEE